jgi:hypothetical protein
VGWEKNVLFGNDKTGTVAPLMICTYWMIYRLGKLPRSVPSFAVGNQRRACSVRSHDARTGVDPAVRPALQLVVLALKLAVQRCTDESYTSMEVTRFEK